MNAPVRPSAFKRDLSAEAFPPEHPAVNFGRIGVLLVNLGTPDGHDKKNMRKYLKEFLSDSRVIETPKIIWWPLLNGIILNVRPKKSGALYASIWNEELDESPLRTFTRSQSDQLTERMGDVSHLEIDWGMRYGNPSIESRLKALQEKGCERILIFPLYPQYSAATTATVNDKAFDALKKMRWMPATRTVPAYHDDPSYIDALAISIQKHLDSLDFKPEHIVASYHGIPKSYFTKGDPYHCHCQKTSRLLKERMGWDEGFLITTFQSRFGPEEWLQPYTDKTVEKLAHEGVKRICVVNPGFSSDCLETLEEIAGEVREEFEDNGGEHFSHIPCLNDGPEGVDLIETIVRRELQGWI
ncbi:ferrochelatase [Ahrensia sp. R2A130]|uniref:ferrochelatase n=1 Tax=Ahrensia sp. R2A130 TaxID=744979 RepID=UPI0001E0C36C|nr:ferrochelatase [Ahrensia sp. R2A130]EFL88782.1 ferrochelatase [Ahrensia sp. R2A130]